MRSMYYRAKCEFLVHSNRPMDDDSMTSFEDNHIKIGIIPPPGLTASLCVYLTCLNVLYSYVQLPDFFKVDTDSFVQVCLHYGFEDMLRTMVRYCTTDGLVHTIPFCRSLHKFLGEHDPMLLSIISTIQDNWYECMLVDYPKRKHNHPNIDVRKFLFGRGSTFVIDLINSLSYRVHHFLTICPNCYLMVYPDSGTVTFCCMIPIHHHCYSDYKGCPRCNLQLNRNIRIFSSNLRRKRFEMLQSRYDQSW